ncbi:MAG: RHS repeat-associated core domain-containing protein [Candidatus Limnocylindrales bacterium]
MATDLASTSASYELGGAGRLHQSVTGPRTTTYTYDALGRTTQIAVTTTGVGTLTTTSTLDGAGRTTAIATGGTSSDSLTEAYDALDRMTSISRAGTAITSFTYNPDGSAATRTDHDAAGTDRASSFTYTPLGQLATATLPGSFGTAAYTWGLDGNLATRTWGSSVSASYTYDRAKRPTGLSIKFGSSVSGTIARTYDRVGNALSETQTLAGVTTTSGLAGSSTQTFGYDAAGRLTSSYFGPSGSPVAPRAYSYDPDSNRTSVTESGTVFYYFYDATDELIKKGPNPDGSGASALGYDSLGQLLTSQPSLPGSGVVRPTTYAYDPAGHLSGITADGVTTSFTIDALGRHAGQTVGSGSATTYAYLGTSDTVSSTAVGGTLSTYSAIDAIGDRLTTGTSSAFAYVLPDLHGNVVATIGSGSSPSYSSAYRYDAYGETCDQYSVGSGAITSPWRYQGRILESASGSTDLYDFSARSYDPSLGAFTSIDSVSGSAQNPLTLNRYLYALANPATLVDPDGHAACRFDREDCADLAKAKAKTSKKPTIFLFNDPQWTGVSYLLNGDGSFVDDSTYKYAKELCLGQHMDPSANICQSMTATSTKIAAAEAAYCADHQQECAERDRAKAEAIVTTIALGLEVLATMASLGADEEIMGPAELATGAAGEQSASRLEELDSEIAQEAGEPLTQEMADALSRQEQGSNWHDKVYEATGLTENNVKDYVSGPGLANNVADSKDFGAIWEFKDVRYVTSTSQLRGEADVAGANGDMFNLIVSENTTAISRGVVQLVKGNSGMIWQFNSQTGVFAKLFDSTTGTVGRITITP